MIEHTQDEDMVDNSNYTIRNMTQDELAFAVELAATEGWNPGLHDAACFYAADPDGYFVGLLDGEPIASISVVKYPGSYAFLGFYIVKEGFRGKGYGYTIWQHAMDSVAGYHVGLDGVLEQVPTYEKSGFVLHSQNARYQAAAVGGGAQDERVIDLADVPFEVVDAYDTAVFGAARTDFLRLWISRPETVAVGVKEGDALAGYAVLRKCREGYKVGPLFADNAEVANTIFDDLLRRAPAGETVLLDIPAQEQNPDAHAIVRKHGMNEVFSTARMYRTDNPDAVNFPLHKWCGITTFELG